MREEIRREHEARRFLLELAREAYPWKVTAYKNKVKMMRRKMKLPTKKAEWTEEQRKEWNASLLESRKAFEDYLITRLERDIGMRDEGRGMRFLERRSPGGDAQNLANTNVLTTGGKPPYGTIGICQGLCQKEVGDKRKRGKRASCRSERSERRRHMAFCLLFCVLRSNLRSK